METIQVIKFFITGLGTNLWFGVATGTKGKISSRILETSNAARRNMMSNKVKRLGSLLLCCIIFSFVLCNDGFGQTISEEAKRYFNRGMAAVEMAKSPEDYTKAIQEFEKAAQLAPHWPDAYFNLGLVQEKAEKFGDAATNLKQYLRLAPNASDAEAVKSHISKLEYKAEHVLTITDIIDVLVSFSNEALWRKSEQCMRPAYLEIKREGLNRVRVMTFYNPEQGFKFSTLKVEGPIVKFTTKFRDWTLAPELIRMFGTKENPIEHQIEVVSKEHVIVQQKITRLEDKGRVYFNSCEYRKK